jgi:hypothetical protein
MGDDPKQGTKEPEPVKEGLSVGDIRKMVTDLVGEAVKGITPTKEPDTDPTKTDPPISGLSRMQATIQRQVEEAVGAIQAKDETARKEQATEDRFKKLEAAVEAAPVERRRVHKLMGWGE